MEKNLQEQLAEKISLIYEYNNQSPLFVRQANTEIENNNLAKAISILEDGLKIFPSNPVAYIILGKALSLQGNYDQAVQAYVYASNIIQSSESLDHYLLDLENVKRHRSAFETSRKTTFVDTTPNQFKVTEVLIPSKSKSLSVDDQLDQLAKKISTAKLSEPADLQNFKPEIGLIPSVEEKFIASETLANIYLSQEQFDEARKVYQQLITKYPDKKEYYLQKIEKIPFEKGSE